MLEDFPELQSARHLWAAGNLPNAVTAFQAAIQSRPQNIRARLEYARALGQQHEIQQAELQLDRALDLAQDNTKAQFATGQVLRSIFRQSRALALFLELHQRDDLTAQQLGELAVLLQQFGRWDEALHVIEQCISIAPQQPEPKLILAQVLRALGRLDEAQRIHSQLQTLPQASPTLQIACWSELCHIQDQLENYDQAVHCAEQAKAIQRQQPQTRHLQEQSRTLTRMFASSYASLDKATIQRWGENAGKSAPGLAIHTAHLLSFPRTGTTLLEQVLDAHPDIVAAPERVIFSKLIFPSLLRSGGRQGPLTATLDAATDTVLAAQASRYRRLHAEVADTSLDDKLLIDKNPNHTSLWAGLYRLLPNSRFIMTRRDPRDVIVSCFLRHFPLSEFSVAFLDWQSACELYASEAKIQNRLRELLPDQCIEVRYEDMLDDLQGEADRVIDFLGLPGSGETTSYLDRTQGKLVNSPSAMEVRKPVYRHRGGRWQNYAKYLHPHRELLDFD